MNTERISDSTGVIIDCL